MASSVQLFHSFQKFHQIIGIYSSQPSRTDCLINLTNKVFIVSSVLYLITTVTFLVFDATSLFDYGFESYVLIAIITGTVIYLLFIWQHEGTLDFIQNCEKFIGKSEYRRKNMEYGSND